MSTPAQSPIQKTVVADTKLLNTLEVAAIEHGLDIAAGASLLQFWSNGSVRRHIIFEQKDGRLHPNALTPTKDEAAYLKERWNPLNGLFVVHPKRIAALPQSLYGNPDALLSHAVSAGWNIGVIPGVEAVEYLKTPWPLPRISQLIRTNQLVRNVILLFLTISKNAVTRWCERTERRAYYTKIEIALQTKKVVLDLEFGGLGDCLSLSSLPRLLKDQHDVTVYLTNRTKTVFRHPDFATVAFDSNPWFGGYVDEPGLMPRSFLADAPWRYFFTGKGKQNAVAELEQQFKVTGIGLPEIHYQPTLLPELRDALLVDRNWYSGSKFGFYNDPSLLADTVASWKQTHPTGRVVEVDPKEQPLTTYIDMIASADHMLCFLSGGNSLAAALRTRATVILPENIDGAAVSNFLFKNAPITYLRRRSLAGYRL